jgi:hypothetical protein
MARPEAAISGALALLLLSACGGQERAPQNQNDAVAAEQNSLGVASPADPAQPGAPSNAATDPAPPPDAVSHPDGYLPPAPAEPGPSSSNSSGTDPSPPATEDEYIRNGQ